MSIELQCTIINASAIKRIIYNSFLFVIYTSQNHFLRYHLLVMCSMFIFTFNWHLVFNCLAFFQLSFKVDFGILTYVKQITDNVLLNQYEFWNRSISYQFEFCRSLLGETKCQFISTIFPFFCIVHCLILVLKLHLGSFHFYNRLSYSSSFMIST